MKSLAIAFLFCALCAVVCFFSLHGLGVNTDLAKATSELVLATFPKVGETLTRDAGASDPSVRSLGAYEISTLQGVLYVSVVGYLALNATNAVGNYIDFLSEVELNSRWLPPIILTFAVAFPFLFGCGVWTGRRCARPVLVAATCAIIIRVGGSLIDWFALSGNEYREYLYTDKSFSSVLFQIYTGIPMFAAMLIPGAVLGRTQKFASYFNYLGKRLTPEGRVALLELAYEEAKRIKQGIPGK